MDKKIFIETMIDLWGKDFNFSEGWDIYNELSNDGDDVECSKRELMEALPQMNKNERLLWRTQLAEQGYELTPTQVVAKAVPSTVATPARSLAQSQGMWAALPNHMFSLKSEGPRNWKVSGRM